MKPNSRSKTPSASLVRLGCALFAALWSFASSALAYASERRFAFTYESNVLAPGEAALEPWTTVRAGRGHFFSAFEQRLAFELGLVRNLQTALYWDFESTSETIRDPSSSALTRRDDFRMRSLASVWQYKFSDALADAVGAALHFEASYGPREVEVAGKLILDKQVLDFLFAANLSAEQAWKLKVGDAESEQRYCLSLAAGYFFTPALVIGAEGFNLTRASGGNLEASSIYAGPSVAWAAERYWLVASAAPQLYAPHGDPGKHLDLTHGERVWARLLLGFTL